VLRNGRRRDLELANMSDAALLNVVSTCRCGMLLIVRAAQWAAT